MASNLPAAYDIAGRVGACQYAGTVPTPLTSWTASSYFGAWERVVTGWDSLIAELAHVEDIAGGRALVWRGVHDASYGLVSSAYRWLKRTNGRNPTEAQLTSFEQALITTARRTWPDRGGSALETLAHIQHYGGPTRLLDVTHEPMVAAFFATETKFDDAHKRKTDVDGRLFAFDASRSIGLEGVWGSRALPWGDPTTPIVGWREQVPFVWDPPSALNERVAAQRGAFLVGGIPSLPKGQNSRYRPPGAWQAGNMKTMPTSTVRDLTSVSLWMTNLDKKTRPTSFATYTLRITQSAKEEIRGRLRADRDFHHGTMYPDLYGLATFGANLSVTT